MEGNGRKSEEIGGTGRKSGENGGKWKKIRGKREEMVGNWGN